MNEHSLLAARKSNISGTGAFAIMAIASGTRVIEFTGLRRTESEAEQTAHNEPISNFGLDDGSVIDSQVGGNDSRFFNHSCSPNCEAVEEDGRIYFEAVRDIHEGEELTLDYQLTLGMPQTPDLQAVYACHCRASACRGTMLADESIDAEVECPS